VPHSATSSGLLFSSCQSNAGTHHSAGSPHLPNPAHTCHGYSHILRSLGQFAHTGAHTHTHTHTHTRLFKTWTLTLMSLYKISIYAERICLCDDALVPAFS